MLAKRRRWLGTFWIVVLHCTLGLLVHGVLLRPNPELTAASSTPPRYFIEELGSLSSSGSLAWRINAAGVAVGASYVDQKSRAVAWKGLVPKDLGLLKGFD